VKKWVALGTKRAIPGKEDHAQKNWLDLENGHTLKQLVTFEKNGSHLVKRKCQLLEKGVKIGK